MNDLTVLKAAATDVTFLHNSLAKFIIQRHENSKVTPQLVEELIEQRMTSTTQKIVDSFKREVVEAQT